MASSQGTWEPVTSPVGNFLRSVYFTNSLHGWAAGNGGAIIHTSDGGETWTVQDSQTGHDIADLVFLNNNYGWAVAHNYTAPPYGTFILKTSDGGQNWTSEPYPEENIFINCVLLRDSLNIWMGGSPHAIVHSTDGGMTWQQAVVDTSILAFFPVLSIQFYNEIYGYASGGMFEIAGVIWRTSDGGQSWQAIGPDQAPADEVHELHLYDSTHVIGAGGDPDFGYGVGFIRTEDGGLNWDYEEIGLPGNAYDLDFRTDQEAWAPLGPRQQMVYSLDGGDTWLPYATPGNTAIFDIHFADSLHGWAVGDNGALLRYEPLPVSVAEGSAVSGQQSAVSVYPNPFRKNTTVKFQIPKTKTQTNSEIQIPNTGSYSVGSSNPSVSLNSNLLGLQSVQLKIFNSHGKEVKILMDGSFPPGEYQSNFDAQGLPPGIYYSLFLINGEIADATKMLKIN